MEVGRRGRGYWTLTIRRTFIRNTKLKTVKKILGTNQTEEIQANSYLIRAWK